MKFYKKLISSLCSLLLLLGLCTTVLPAEAKAVSGTCGDNLTWTVENDVLTISGTGPMKDYGTYSDTAPWPSYISSIIIEDGVTTIGKYAFYEYRNLTNVTIGDSVTAIGAFSFERCEALTSVTLGNSVTVIEAYAFYRCESLNSINIPSSVTAIEGDAFSFCYPKEVHITDLGSWCRINFHNDLNIDDWGVATPMGSSNARLYLNGKEVSGELVIPNGVTSLGDYLFRNCDQITSVVIPDSVTEIGQGAFADCDNLKYNTYDSCRYLGNKNNPYLALMGPEGACKEEITVHASTKLIAESAFDHCTALKRVNMDPEASLHTICAKAFFHTNITSVTIPSSVIRIGGGAFEDNTWKETDVEPLKSIHYLGTSAQWDRVLIDTDWILGDIQVAIKNATVHFNDSYGTWKKINDKQHSRTCTVCSEQETAEHTWDSGAVTKKATCKETGVKTYTCTGCNAQKTETVAKLTTHTYDYSCDDKCNSCGATRTVSHKYQAAWSKDKTNHWHECSVCGGKADTGKHTPGLTAQSCTVCGFEMTADSPVIADPTEPGQTEGPTVLPEDVPQDTTGADTTETLPEMPDTDPEIPTQTTEETATENKTTADNGKNVEADRGKGFPWWICIVLLAAGGAAAAVIIFIKKKKT